MWIVIGSIFIIGYLIQQIVLYFPLFYKRKFSPSQEKKLKHSPKIAHRGCREEGLPENTIAAFQHALKNESDTLECDVWLTSDNKVVIHHDESLLRMTGVDKKIYDVSFDALPPIKCDIINQCERISDFPLQNCNRIPTLQDVLEILPQDKYLNIEFKQDNWELIKQVHQQIVDSKKKDQIYWFSLDEKTNKKLYQYDREISNICSILGLLKLLVFYYLGILPFVEIEADVFGITVEEITLEKIEHEKALKNVPQWVKLILAWLFQGRPPHLMLVPKLFTHLRRRGLPVWFLGVNSEDDLRLAVNSGATAVLTDRIEWLNSTIKKEKLVFKTVFD